MITVTTNYSNAITAKVRRIKAKITTYKYVNSSTYKGYALSKVYTQNDTLKSIEIQRVGEDSKFFGFGVAHKANVKIIDVDRSNSITTAFRFHISLGIELEDGTVEYVDYPPMYVTEVHRDETTGELSVTMYDKLNDAAVHTTAELGINTSEEAEVGEDESGAATASLDEETATLTAPYTIREFVKACGLVLGISVSMPADIAEFDLSYENGANLEGTETFRTALNAIAEATQTIFYINNNNVLTFKRLDKDGDPVKTIDMNTRITADTADNRRLGTIANITELGDNLSASLEVTGTTQYIRNNPFWETREDLATLIDNALAQVGGMTINEFSCTWRGDPALEIGDKIALVTDKGNSTITSYLLNDTITFDGGLEEKTEWNFNSDNSETASNPTSIGETLRYTYAKVDKVNQQIDIVAKNIEVNSETVSALQLNTEAISASVKQIQESTESSLATMNDSIGTLTTKVDAAITSENLSIEVQKELANGVNSVTTTTGFTFDEVGLTVSKSGSEMTTQITEDGMTVYRDDEAMLTADNTGVKAVNLHATTYLIIGNNSRLEDWEKDGEARTACFWIGGKN